MYTLYSLKTEYENVIRKSALTRLHSIDSINKQSELLCILVVSGGIPTSRSINEIYALTYITMSNEQ